MSPRETVRGHVASFPVVCRWVALLPRQGGGRTIEAFDDNFFDWWALHIPVIEDYPYTRINFSRDMNMPVPPGEEGGEIVCVFLKLFNFFIFIFIYIIVMCIRVYKNCVSVMYKCGTSASDRLLED